LRDTWIVVVADHGESLGEQDYWFEHGFNASEATCRVPLIVRPPSDLAARPTPGRRAGAISLADLAPTLHEWLDLPFDGRAASAITGVSRAKLLAADDPAPFATYCEKLEGEELSGTIQIKAVRFGGFKLIRRWAHFDDREKPGTKVLRPLGDELYDLRVDPFETRDLAAAPPTDAPLATLREKLLDFAAADKSLVELEAILTKRRAALEASDADALRELKALGY
jgi:arylsulfatase A-like enzyme